MDQIKAQRKRTLLLTPPTSRKLPLSRHNEILRAVKNVKRNTPCLAVKRAKRRAPTADRKQQRRWNEIKEAPGGISLRCRFRIICWCLDSWPSEKDLIRNWSIAYIGNICGCLLIDVAWQSQATCRNRVDSAWQRQCHRQPRLWPDTPACSPEAHRTGGRVAASTDSTDSTTLSRHKMT